jgi:hypothetical protein
MKRMSPKPASGTGGGDGGLVLFDEYLNDEDFLEFLVEWSDSIVQKDSNGNITSGGVGNMQREKSAKRKIEEVSNSSKPTEKLTTAQIDAELVKLPINIFDAFNTGDLTNLTELINKGMTRDCLFKTMMIDKPLVGSHYYAEFWCKLAVSHPDMVFILKKVRVINNVGEPRAIKFNYFFTGTNAFPGATETYYYNNDDYLTKNLDCSKYSEKEKAAMNLLVQQHRAHGTPYVVFGRGTGLYELNEENKVCKLYFEWKLTSICPPVGENSSHR